VTDVPATLHALVIEARERLVRAGVFADNAAIDAEVLARTLLGWERARYLAERDAPPPESFTRGYGLMIERRIAREPVAQIVGRREFWGADFEVTRDVLTPRPETELVVEEALARLGTAKRLVDVGTGAGVLALTLARERPDVRIVATDISIAALAVAVRNARAHGMLGRVAFVCANLLEGLAGPFDAVVSNPPYVPDGAARALSPEVRDYEPSVALFGGPEGFTLIQALLAQASNVLTPGGLLVHEFGAGQEERMRATAAGAPRLELLAIRDDLQGIPRVAVFRKR
jgi:release factor glutamine methyltransferase